MLTNMTRSRLIQAWFAVVALAIVTGVVFDAAVTASTLSMLLALTFVPPTIVLLLWPGTRPLTAAEVLYDRERGA
jgi:ammonia channel protein AmtB